MKVWEVKVVLDRHWMRCLLRMQPGKYMLSPESPEQNAAFCVACCHAELTLHPQLSLLY